MQINKKIHPSLHNSLYFIHASRMSSPGNKEIICSIFKNISSQTAGAILNVDNVDIKLVSSCFYRINSNAFPGCFLVKNSKFTLISCYFDYCYTKGSNEAFGKISYVRDSTANIKYFSALACGPSVSSIGDSLNIIYNSKSDINSYNTSYCYGEEGSASISIWCPKVEPIVKYINCVDCIDWCSYEYFRFSLDESVLYSNFINSTNNSHYCINLKYGNNTSTFKNCAFFSVCNNFCSAPNYLKLIDCVSDKNQGYFTFNTTTSLLSFKLILKVPHDCITKVCHRYLSPRLIHAFIMISIISY